jgi:hypothetical protein
MVVAEPIKIDGLMTNLRENWESPVGYLVQRGYLQRNNNETANNKKDTFMETAMNATKSFLGQLKQTWTGWLHSNSTNKSTRGISFNLSAVDLEAMKKNIEIDKKHIRYMLDCLKNIKFEEKEADGGIKETTETTVFKTNTTDNNPCTNQTVVLETLSSSKETPSSALRNYTTDSKYITRKLEYLAHLHHPVELVGNPKNEALNLQKIQALIDKIKYSPDNEMYGMDNNDESKNNTSEDPGRPCLLLPPYAENYLVRNKRTSAKSFTDKLTEISKYLNKSLNKGQQQQPEVQSEPAHESPKEIQMDDLLALHLSDEQTAEIEKFQNELNAPPQQFNFDIQPYLDMSPKKLDPEVGLESVTPRTYFEFDDLQTHQDDKRALKPSDSYVPLNVAAMHQKPLQRDLMDYNRDANEFVDNYYMLNDGHTNVDEVLPADEKEILMPSNMNMEDLSIDLKLNKEFRELEDVTGPRHHSDKYRT